MAKFFGNLFFSNKADNAKTSDVNSALIKDAIRRERENYQSQVSHCPNLAKNEKRLISSISRIVQNAFGELMPLSEESAIDLAASMYFFSSVMLYCGTEDGNTLDPWAVAELFVQNKAVEQKRSDKELFQLRTAEMITVEDIVSHDPKLQEKYREYLRLKKLAETEIDKIIYEYKHREMNNWNSLLQDYLNTARELYVKEHVSYCGMWLDELLCKVSLLPDDNETMLFDEVEFLERDLAVCGELLKEERPYSVGPLLVIYQLYARALSESGFYYRALAALQTLYETNPFNFRTNSSMVECALHQNDLDKACIYLHAALAMSFRIEHFCDIFRLAGLYYMKKERWIHSYVCYGLFYILAQKDLISSYLTTAFYKDANRVETALVFLGDLKQYSKSGDKVVPEKHYFEWLNQQSPLENEDDTDEKLLYRTTWMLHEVLRVDYMRSALEEMEIFPHFGQKAYLQIASMRLRDQKTVGDIPDGVNLEEYYRGVILDLQQVVSFLNAYFPDQMNQNSEDGKQMNLSGDDHENSIDAAEIRFWIEQRMLRDRFFSDPLKFISEFGRDRSGLYLFYITVMKNSGIDPPYKEEEFGRFVRNQGEAVMLCFTLPEPEQDSLCYRTYFMVDRTGTKAVFYTIERAGLHARLCEVTETEHLDRGEIRSPEWGSDEEDARLKLIAESNLIFERYRVPLRNC